MAATTLNRPKEPPMMKKAQRLMLCWQLNTQHSIMSTSHCSKKPMKASEATIAFIQKPYYAKTGRIISLGKGCGIKPRACIASKNTEICYCPFHSSRDVVTAIGKWSGRQIYLVSAYFDCTVDQVPEALIKTLEAATGNDAEVLICAR